MPRNLEEVFAAIQDIPGIRDVFRQTDGLSEEDRMRCLSEIMAGHPELLAEYQEAIQQTFAEAAAKVVVSSSQDGKGMFIKPHGQAQLNPLVEAALIERIQFDDDIPELRTAGMAPGVMPAVSVATNVRSPVALGIMLKEASQQVAAKILAAEPQRQAFLAAIAQGTDDEVQALVPAANAPVDEVRDRVLDGKHNALDIPEYRRGQVPAPVRVGAPSGSALLAMTPAERKQSAWKFLSTTQGRRTAEASLQELIAVKLRGEGFEVRVRPFEPGARETVLAAHEWTVRIDGSGAVQSAFSLIDVAAASIARGLTKSVGDLRGTVILEVTSINTVDIRSVGWAGRLLGEPMTRRVLV